MQDLSVYNLDYYEREIEETWFAKQGLLRPDQLAAICYAFGMPFWGEPSSPRTPKQVYSIGCGTGDLEVQLEKMGCEVIGVDPSIGAKKTYGGKTLVDEYPGGGDTIIFCESIEHLPRYLTLDILEAVPQGARIIIVNWVDFFPIPEDGTGLDHITRIDQGFFDMVKTYGKTILERGSHLVIEKE